MLLLTLAVLVADPVTPAPQADEKKICRTLGVTGTRLGGGRRECRTKAGWLQYDRQVEEDTRALTDTSNVRFKGQ